LNLKNLNDTIKKIIVKKTSIREPSPDCDCGYFIGFYIHHFFKKEEIKNLFYQIRQEVIKKTKQEERIN